MTTKGYFEINWPLELFQPIMVQKSEPLWVGKTTFHTFSSRSTQRTLCCICLGRCCLGLETRVIIEISTYRFCPINVDSFSWDEAIFFSKKTKQNGWFKRTEIFNSANFQYSLARISGIGPWLRRKNWCDVAQSVWSSGCPMHWTAWLQCKLKKGLKMHFFVKYFTSLWLKLDWKHSIYIGAVSS